MFIPKVLPDEFVRGYRGRMLRCNSLASGNKAHIALRKLLLDQLIDRHDGSDLNIELNLYAIANHMSPQEFACRHSMLPFIRAFAAQGKAWKHGSVASSKLTKDMGMHSARTHPMHCIQCVEEDLNFWGFAYFRRTHQIPGVNWCQKHGMALTKSTDWYAFDLESGQCLLTEGKKSEVNIKSLFKQHRVIRNYVELATAFLDVSHSFEVKFIANKLVEKLTQLEMDKTPSGLKRLMLNSYEDEWLNEIFSYSTKATKNPIKNNFAPLLSRCESPLSSEKYLALLNLLFEDVTLTLNWLNEPLISAIKPIQSRKKYATEFWQTKEIYDLYINSRGSHRKIAIALDRHIDISSRFMKRNGLPSLGVLTEPEFGALLDFYFNESSLMDACQHHDVDPKKIESIIRIAGNRFANMLKEILSAKKIGQKQEKSLQNDRNSAISITSIGGSKSSSCGELQH